MSYYSLDAEIEHFFSQTPVTCKQCDHLATELTGETVHPVPLQGAFSYTLVGGDQIIQFPSLQSPLDTNKQTLARKIFGKLVPVCVQHGEIAPSPSLSIHVMQKIPGVTLLEASLKGPCYIFAGANSGGFCTVYRPNSSPNPGETSFLSYMNQSSHYPIWESRLNQLIIHLPGRFTSAIHTIRNTLPVLFSSEYPLTLFHGDLCEMNIMVDFQTGGITGIIDWAEARILPFGMALSVVQNMLGVMDSKGWHYYGNASELEGLFWEEFYGQVGGISDAQKHAIIVAEKAGLVLRYGFTWDDGVHERPVTEMDSSIRYLDAFLQRL